MYSEFIGRTLKEVIPDLDFSYKEVVVFLLQSENDRTGRRVAEDYSLKLLLTRFPNLSDKKIVRINDYYNQTIFRVL